MKKGTLTILSIFLYTLCFCQFDYDKLDYYAGQLESIETKFDQQKNNIEADLARYNNTLDTLGKEAKPLDALLKRVEILEGKQQRMAEISTQEKHRAIELSRIRYEVGLLVIKDIIEYLNTLQSQFSSIDFQESYADLSNPNSFPIYRQNIERLKEKPVRKEFTLPEMGMGMGMSNAFFNTAYFLTHAIVSNRKDKSEITQQTVCILDFTSEASNNLRIISFDLQYLSSELQKMTINFDELFRNYTAKVGYSMGFNDYITADGDLLDTDLIPGYFEALQNDNEVERSKKLRDINYSIKKIMDAYQEYEIFVRQGLAYYEKFALIVSTLTPQCEDQIISADIQARFENMSYKLNRAKLDFEKAYRGKIKQTYLKQLITP